MIDSTARIAKNTIIGKNVAIGAYTIIHSGVSIGDNSIIGPFCELGVSCSGMGRHVLKIGKDSIIRSHSVFYKNSIFGKSLSTGHAVIVRENTQSGPGLQVGCNSEIQGHCTFGRFVKMQSNVFIPQGTKLGNFVWIMPGVCFTNDPFPPSNIRKGSSVGDYACVGAGALILPGVHIGTDSLVAAHSCVTRNVAAHSVVAGVPAKRFKNIDEIYLDKEKTIRAYPWRRHFHSKYPAFEIKKMKKK